MNIKNYVDYKSLEKKYGVMTLGFFLKATREADEISQAKFARRLGISRANLCDLEKGRRLVSPEKAAQFARILKVPEIVLVKLALQDSLRSSSLHYLVDLRAA